MKKDIHPENYRLVVFKDTSSDTTFLMGSTIETEETIKWEDGNEYPLVNVEISSKSHPFYTGERKEMDTAGRADKFRKRMAAAQDKKAAAK
jgi:large subunit ribosomal protein L31